MFTTTVRLASIGTGDTGSGGIGRGMRASPSGPVSIRCVTKMLAHWLAQASRRYRKALGALGSARHALPQGTDREVAFLNKLETLLKREIGGGG